MVTGNAILVIDFGNSSTRIQTKFGNNTQGQPRVKTVEVSNTFAKMTQEAADRYISEGDYTAEDSRIFKTAGSDIYCTGNLCNTEYEKTAERPTALMAKYKSVNLKWSLMTALCYGYEAIAEFSNCDLDSIDVTWDIVTLLPPDDVDEGAKVIAETARKISKIEFLMPVLSHDIKINKVKVFPEGFAAFIAILYEGVGVLREGYKYLVDPHSVTLIADIGAGTSDFLVVRAGKVVASSRFTRTTGGNNVHQTLRRMLKKKGISLKDTYAREGCETGYIYNGAEKVNIIADIDQAKTEVSRDLIDALVEYFESTMIEVQSITNIITVGGGSVESSVEGIYPISKYLVDYIKNLSPHINWVQLPEMKNGKKMDARMANVIGAGILAG